MAKGSSGMRPAMQRRGNFGSKPTAAQSPPAPAKFAAGGVAKERLGQNTVGKVKRK